MEYSNPKDWSVHALIQTDGFSKLMIRTEMSSSSLTGLCFDAGKGDEKKKKTPLGEARDVR